MPDSKNQPDFTDPYVLNTLMRPPQICICRSVGETDIRKAVQEKGAHHFEAVQALTGCGTGCGTCRRLVEDKIREFLTAGKDKQTGKHTGKSNGKQV